MFCIMILIPIIIVIVLRITKLSNNNSDTNIGCRFLCFSVYFFEGLGCLCLGV